MMPYDTNDPRSQLGGTRTAERPAGGAYPPQYFEFGDLAPDNVSAAGTKSWHVRSQTLCVVFSEVAPGDSLTRSGQPDEYMVLFTSPDAAATATAGGQSEAISGKAVVVMPPGDSELVVASGGQVVRLFSTQAADLVARCRNADVYARPDPNVADWQPWPDPPGGHRIRVYPLDAIAAGQRALRPPAAVQHDHGELLLSRRRAARSDTSSALTTTTTSSRSRCSSKVTTCTTSARRGPSTWTRGATTTTSTPRARPSP